MIPQYHSLPVDGSTRCVDTITSVPRPLSLRPYVLGYAGFRAEGEGQLRRRLLSLNLTTVIIDVDGMNSLVTGPRNTPVLWDQAEWSHGVAVGLTPAGVSALLGLPARELVGLAVPLDAILGVRAQELVGRLGLMSDWSSRFASLDDALVAWLRPGLATDALHLRAWWRLQYPTAATTIGDVATSLGLSRRALELRFQRSIGQSPKVVARIARFHRALNGLSRPGSRLAMATEYGYADQAHLSREVRALSGLAPTELFAFVQDAEPSAG